MQLYFKDWSEKFHSELKRTSSLRIISPFVQRGTLEEIVDGHTFDRMELVTRLNEEDFALRVSSLDGLRHAVEKGASVFGVKGLHSKVYLFDDRSAIVTSANLTQGGLRNNLECGIHTRDKEVVRELLDYFDGLKRNGHRLTLKDCEEWQAKLSKMKLKIPKRAGFVDHGGESDGQAKGVAYYIKFFGNDKGRVRADFTIREEIERSECHYACGYPQKKRPVSVNTGDVIFMARMTTDPRGYSIFGEAVAIKFVPGRDEATNNEKARKPWKEKWPVYLRVSHPVFIDATIGDCLTLQEVAKKYKAATFESTKRRFKLGDRGINPMHALMQKAQMQLTPEAAKWIEQDFQKRLSKFGSVDRAYIDSMPRPDVEVPDSE